MAGQDFSGEDRLDSARFNAALWRGVEGDASPPTLSSTADLRQGCEAMLAESRIPTPCIAATPERH
jgi:hypothetical protein